MIKSCAPARENGSVIGADAPITLWYAIFGQFYRSSGNRSAEIALIADSLVQIDMPAEPHAGKALGISVRPACLPAFRRRGIRGVGAVLERFGQDAAIHGSRAVHTKQSKDGGRDIREAGWPFGNPGCPHH